MKGLHTLLVFLPALLWEHEASCQDTTARFSLIFSPALFIPVSVAVQAGVQFRVSRRWSLLAEAALPTFYPKNTKYEEITYWRTGIEIKYYPGKINDKKTYLSLQNNFLFRRLTDNDQDLYYTKTETFSYRNAVIQTPVLASSIKVGVELKAGKRTFIDAFLGIGLRFIFTDYEAETTVLTSTEPPKQNLLKFDDAWLFNYTLIRPHATAGLRFGWRW